MLLYLPDKTIYPWLILPAPYIHHPLVGGFVVTLTLVRGYVLGNVPDHDRLLDPVSSSANVDDESPQLIHLTKALT